jgi:predicted aspartyl protease
MGVILAFPYRIAADVEASPSAPEIPVYRPMIPLLLIGPHGRQALTFALVDTGADDTLLPMYLVASLGIKLESKVYALFGASGRAIQVRYGIVEIEMARPEIGSYRWEAKVGFQAVRPTSVLGRAGCLDRLGTFFDGPNRQVVITTP